MVVQKLKVIMISFTKDTGALLSELTAGLKSICLVPIRVNTNYCSRTGNRFSHSQVAVFFSLWVQLEKYIFSM